MLVVLTTLEAITKWSGIIKAIFLLELLNELSIYIYIYRRIIIFRTLDKNSIFRHNIFFSIWCSHKYEKDKETNMYIIYNSMTKN